MSLFENFLSDSSVYDKAVTFWDELCFEKIEKNVQKDKWKKWFKSRTINNVEIRDGNPITSWFNEQDNKGIRIIQVEKSSIPILAYMDVFDKEVSPIDTLVLRCYLTEKTVETSGILIDYWISNYIEPKEMQRKIDEILKQE